MNKPTDLVLLSGGLDSAVMAYQLASEGKTLRGIYVNTGFKPHTQELASAKHIANTLNFHLEVVDAPGLLTMTSAFYPSEFVGLDEWDKSRPLDPVPNINYVTGFHVLVSMASFYAMLAGIETVNVGILADQVKNRPGLKTFIDGWNKTIDPLNPKVSAKLKAPFKSKNKSDLVKMAQKLGLDLSRTWTCYRGLERQCGECGGCISRQEAFKKAKVTDATVYMR